MTQICPTAAALVDTAAALFVNMARDAVEARSLFTVALAGGSTPKQLYARLAQHAASDAGVPWSGMHFFWGDERHVPPDHPDSNYGMAHEALLRHVPVTSSHMHRMKGEHADAHVAATKYEAELREFFHLAPGEWPRLDLVLLGLGADGHTASLFPGTTALAERAHLVVSTAVRQLGVDRITLTVPVLNHAARVVFLVEGAAKAAAVASVLEGPYQPDRYPAQLVRPDDGELLWLLDAAAAARLGGRSPASVSDAM